MKNWYSFRFWISNIITKAPRSFNVDVDVDDVEDVEEVEEDVDEIEEDVVVVDEVVVDAFALPFSNLLLFAIGAGVFSNFGLNSQ